MNRGLLGLALSLGSCAAAADPAEVDALVRSFNDPQSAYERRVDSLARLRSLVAGDEALSRRTQERIRPRLWVEVQRWHSLALTDLERRALMESLAWLAELRDPDIRFQMEFHLERETVRRKRLPEEVLRAIALHLGRYPESASVRETLWAAVADPGERPTVRGACLKSLQALESSEWEKKLLALSARPEDAWLKDLQASLR